MLLRMLKRKKNKLSISMIAQYKKEFYWARLLHYSYTRKEKKNKKKFQPIKVPKNFTKK